MYYVPKKRNAFFSVSVLLQGITCEIIFVYGEEQRGKRYMCMDIIDIYGEENKILDM